MNAAVVSMLACGFGFVLLGRPLPARSTLVIDDVGQLVAAAAAAAACFWAAFRSVERGRVVWAWSLLGAGCGLWAAGEGVWSYYELATGRAVPFPSLADVGFMSFTLLAAAALLVLPTGLRAAAARLRDLLDGLIIAGSLLVVAWATSLGAAVDAGGATRLELALSLAYPLGDLVVVTLVLLAVGRPGAARRGVLGLLAGGLLALAVADSAFVYLTTTGSYGSGQVCDLGWVAGFGLVALAATLATTPAPPAPAVQTRAPSRLRLTLPYWPLLCAEVVVAAQQLSGSHRAPAQETVVALGLIVLVLTRQFLALADHQRLLVDLREQREHARQQALHDPLTGLANRTLFHDRVEHALALHARDDKGTTVLFCDVDDFKTVNDRMGHAAGDELLVELAQRLCACVRPGDTVARLGGDEFAVLIQERVEPPTQVAARLVDALSVPAGLVGTVVAVSVSVGVATAKGLGGDRIDAGELLRRADTAMYAAKADGKATWASYDIQVTTEQPRKLLLRR